MIFLAGTEVEVIETNAQIESNAGIPIKNINYISM